MNTSNQKRNEQKIPSGAFTSPSPINQQKTSFVVNQTNTPNSLNNPIQKTNTYQSAFSSNFNNDKNIQHNFYTSMSGLPMNKPMLPIQKGIMNKSYMGSLKQEEFTIDINRVRAFLKVRSNQKGINIDDSIESLSFLDNMVKIYLKNIIQSMIFISRKRNYSYMFPKKKEGQKIAIRTYNYQREYAPTEIKINLTNFKNFYIFYPMDVQKRIDIIQNYERKKLKEQKDKKEELIIKKRKNSDELSLKDDDEERYSTYDYAIYDSPDCSSNFKIHTIIRKIDLKDLIIYLEKNVNYPCYRKFLQVTNILTSFYK